MLRVILVIFLIFPSFAQAENITRATNVIPDGSPFSFEKQHPLFGHTYYKGEAKITVYYEIEDNVLYVFPDQESIKILPCLTVRPNEGTPTKITIRDKKWIRGDDAAEHDKSIPSLDTVIADLTIRGTRKKNSEDVDIIMGNATIIIDNYYAGYECDNPFFLSRIKKIVKIETNVTFSAKSDINDCL